MSFIAKSLFALALVFLLLSVALEFVPARQASDLDQFERYAGSAPWAVGGIRPGDASAPHLAKLGPPERDTDMKPGRVLRWSRPEDLTLSVTSDGEIVEVLGQSLTAAGKTLVHAGLSQAEIERVLGRGKVTRSTRPTGSGVISLGSTEVARILTYENGEVRFEITLEEDRVKHVRAVKAAPRR